MRVLLSNCFVTVRENDLENLSVVTIWTVATFCWYQMQLSKKLKTFCLFFCPFFKSASNFEDFESKDDFHSLCISEITDCERHG